MSFDIPPGAIGAGASAVLTPLIIKLLSRLRSLRYRPPCGFEMDVSVLRKRYWKVEGASLLPYFASVAFMTWLLYRGFLCLAGLRQAWCSPSNMFMGVTQPVWFLLAVFPAMVLGMYPVVLVLRFAIGLTKLREFIHYSNLRYGIDQMRFAKGFLVFCIGAEFVLVPLAADYYVRVDEQSLSENRFWSISEEAMPLRNINQVRRIESHKAPNGTIVRQPFYEVEFKDGNVWSSDHWSVNGSKQKVDDFIRSVAKGAQKPITSFDPFRNQ